MRSIGVDDKWMIRGGESGCWQIRQISAPELSRYSTNGVIIA